jgi:hypothetical protein
MPIAAANGRSIDILTLDAVRRDRICSGRRSLPKSGCAGSKIATAEIDRGAALRRARAPFMRPVLMSTIAFARLPFAPHRGGLGSPGGFLME